MQATNIYQLERLHLPIEKYNFIVRTLTSVDGGQNFYYCGNSRYFETEAEAIAYKQDKERRQELCRL